LAAYTYVLDGVGNRTAVVERTGPPNRVYLPLVARGYVGGAREVAARCAWRRR
jgi:hypothetical protein